MQLETIDHIVIAVEDVAKAREPLERLGLPLTPLMTHGGGATTNSAFFAGNEGTEFYVELLGIADPAAAATTQSDAALAKRLETGGGAHGLAFTATDAAAVRGALAGLPGGFTEDAPARDDGTPIATVFRPADPTVLGVPFTVIVYAEPLATRRARHRDAGLFANPLGIRRMDHLAAIVHHPDDVVAAWDRVFGVPVFGEVRTPAMVIRQVKVGDAILELLSPATPDSGIYQRPEGLAAMAAFEVADIQAAVAHARACGFTVADPGPGPLPGTHTSTIPAAELGFGLQLLQYV